MESDDPIQEPTRQAFELAWAAGFFCFAAVVVTACAIVNYYDLPEHLGALIADPVPASLSFVVLYRSALWRELDGLHRVFRLVFAAGIIYVVLLLCLYSAYGFMYSALMMLHSDEALYQVHINY